MLMNEANSRSEEINADDFDKILPDLAVYSVIFTAAIINNLLWEFDKILRF